MEQAIVNRINICFMNSNEAKIMEDLLTDQGVSELDDLKLVKIEDFYNKGIDNAKLKQFFELDKPIISDAFYNKIKSIFTNADQLSNVVSILSKHYIIDEQSFLQSNIENCGLKYVQYKKIKELCQHQCSISFQPKIMEQKQPQGLFLRVENGLEIYQYFCEKFEKNDAKIILTIGETGSGKTKLLNFMANYLQDIQLSDPFRYIMICENSKQTQDQSQTQIVQEYYIRGKNGKPNVIVVDTPGFCDTQNKDKQIVQQLGDFFLTLKDIHLVGFVLKSSDNKLTVKQQYIFSSILQIFGKDIAENIVSFLTFTDSQEPGALVALKAKDSPFQNVIHKIKEPWYFLFNNSALYADPQTELTPLFWKIGIKSFDALFSKKISSIPRKQLIQTGLVICETQTLHYMVNGLQRQLDQTLQHIYYLKDLQRQIEVNKSNIENNKKFNISTKVPSIKQVPLTQEECITNCRDCQFSCHYVCQLYKHSDKRLCAAINDDYCKVCPKKCHVTKHGYDPFQYVPIMIEKIITRNDMLNSYNSAIQQENMYNALLTKSTNELRLVYSEAIQLQVQIVSCMNKLDEIALIQPECKSQIQYIELMEINELNNKTEGWQTRLKVYGGLKNNWQLIEEAYSRSGKFQSLMQFAQEWLSDTNLI